MGPKPPVLPVSSTAAEYRRIKSEVSSGIFVGFTATLNRKNPLNQGGYKALPKVSGTAVTPASTRLVAG
jgi:hypothetical protein